MYGLLSVILIVLLKNKLQSVVKIIFVGIN